MHFEEAFDGYFELGQLSSHRCDASGLKMQPLNLRH